MRQTPTYRPRLRRPLAIAMLAILGVVLILKPALAGLVIIAASVIAAWGFWFRPRKPSRVLSKDDRREPSLWDDGFGQMG